MKLRTFAIALAALLPAIPAYADAALTLDHGTVWATQKPGEDTEGFLQIHNSGDTPDTLTGGNCTIAASTVLVDAKGNALDGITIDPGKTVTLSPDGPHFVIKAARYPVEKDGILPCAISFELSGQLIGYLNAVPAPRKH